MVVGIIVVELLDVALHVALWTVKTTLGGVYGLTEYVTALAASKEVKEDKKAKECRDEKDEKDERNRLEEEFTPIPNDTILTN